MTTNPVTRDEFEIVKELLASAARYAESANRGIEDLRLAQAQTEVQMQRLMLAQERTEQRLESFIYEVQRLTTSHAERIDKLEGISERLVGVLAYLMRKDQRGDGGSFNGN